MTTQPNDLEKTILSIVDALQHGTGRVHEGNGSPIMLTDGVPTLLVRAELAKHITITASPTDVSSTLAKLATRRWLECAWQDDFFWPLSLRYKRPDGCAVSIQVHAETGLHEGLLDGKTVCDDLDDADDDGRLPEGFACLWITETGLAILDGDGCAAASASVPKPKITCDEANIKARELLVADRAFASKTSREWAEAVGCSPGLVVKLPAWKAVMDRRRQQGIGKKPKAVGLTDKLLKVTGRDNDPSENAAKDEIMRRVMEQALPEEKAQLNNLSPEERRSLAETYDSQIADTDISPIEDDLPDAYPRTVRTRKSL